MPSSNKEKSKHTLEKPQEPQSWTLFQGDTELGKVRLVLKQRINEFLNGPTYAIISTLILIFTLFSDDIRQISFPVTADLGFTIVTLICMIYYMIEIVVFSLVQKDYFLGYYFWLDLVSTLTMTFDLVWVTQHLTGGGKNAANISQISRASRAARLGTRTVKLIRLIRMIKLLKQMKALSKDIVKNQKEEHHMTKRLTQRISSMHSKVTSRIASMRNMERFNSVRHDKLPSKRWSMIKDMGCIGPAPIPVPVSKNLISISCLPYPNQDCIVDKESASKKSVSSRKIESFKKIVVQNREVEKVEHRPSPQIATMPIFEEIRQEAKEDYEEENKPNNLLKSKKTKMQDWKKGSTDDIIPSDTEIMMPPESKVGARVQQNVQKNVISMIILILLSIPLLDGSTWFETLSIYNKAQSSLVYYAENFPSDYQLNADLFIDQAMNNFQNPLLYFSIEAGTVTDNFPDNYAYAGDINTILENTRSDDIELISGNGYTFGYDISAYNKNVSIFNIARTVFVCLLLIITTIFFSSDLEFTAIAPLEDMMETVRKIAINPLNAIREIEEKNMCLEKLEQDEGKMELTEPKMLQNTIVKISSLLAIGFGEAGTEIICKVIEDPSIIDVMIPGQKIMALFGFCDIRNFTDATEILEADVMVFVNEIAAICHKEVYEHLGSPNKNIGDAFLLVWKFGQKDVKVTEKEDQAYLELMPSNRVSHMADLSVLAFVKMVSQIARSETLQKYKENKRLQNRIPNYFGVKMGFGLHFGWAIEGPIGSEYKIDASYLGKDVHMASRLEGATKAYGTGMLITESVYDLMTDNRRHLRHIDNIMPEGDKTTMKLYTVDLDYRHLFEKLGVKKQKKMTSKEKKTAKVYQSIARKDLLQNLEKGESIEGLWNDPDIKAMQEVYTPRFYDQWNKGFKSYVDGNWQVALEQLTKASNLGPDGVDGPSKSLIEHIEKHKLQAPMGWKGYRSFE